MKYSCLCSIIVISVLVYCLSNLMENAVAKNKHGMKSARKTETRCGRKYGIKCTQKPENKIEHKFEVKSNQKKLKVNKKLKEAGKACIKNSQKPKTRIATGNDTQHLYPWMVAIYMYETRAKNDTSEVVEPVCGGSLITKEHVLTAAKCVHINIFKNTSKTIEVKLNAIFVRLGDLDLMSPHDDQQRKVMNMKVKQIIAHEKYNQLTFENDIALIKLKKAIKYTKYIAPVCIPGLNGPEVPWKRNAVVITVGWGLEGINKSDSHTLKEAQLSLWLNSFCERNISHPLNEEFVCAGSWLKNVSVCTGDEGGPLMPIEKTLLPFIIGIASFSLTCTNLPTIFTNVSHYIKWINEKVK